MQHSHLETFDEIRQILCRCEQLKGDIKSLDGNHVKSYRSAFKGGEFLPRIRMYLFQIYIIQLCMILNPKEHHSLSVLIRALLNDPSVKWNDNNAKQETENALARIEALESAHNTTLRILRDKFWAHRDRQRNNHIVSLTYDVGWRILDELKQIFNIINIQVWKKETRFDILSNQEPIELAHLARYGKMYQRLQPERLQTADDLTTDLIYLMRGIDRERFN